MIIIGEKLSIIAKRVREAMMKKDKGPIQEIATAQWKAGAGMIDANIGPTNNDLEILEFLKDHGKNIVVVANKIDKIKKSECKHQLKKIEALVGVHKFIPYSAENKIGVSKLINEL